MRLSAPDPISTQWKPRSRSIWSRNQVHKNHAPICFSVVSGVMGTCTCPGPRHGFRGRDQVLQNLGHKRCSAQRHFIGGVARVSHRIVEMQTARVRAGHKCQAPRTLSLPRRARWSLGFLPAWGACLRALVHSWYKFACIFAPFCCLSLVL